MTALALDTSAAIPLLVQTHREHAAVYDALAAIEHGAQLATRDARAKATYETVGVDVVTVG